MRLECYPVTGSNQGVRHMMIERDGVRLAYEEMGQGSPVVLAHSWALDRESLRPLAEQLARRHRVILGDLRGFGESDAPTQRYAIGDFADDLEFLSRQLGLERPALVGHSMGGTVVLDAAARFPDRWSAAVILEALVVAPPPLMAQFQPVLEGARSPAFRDVLRHFATSLAGPFMEPGMAGALADTMSAGRQEVLVSALEDVLAFDSAAAATQVRCPLLYVSSGPWYTDVERFRSLCPQLSTAQLVGVGHYFPLEVPEIVGLLIDRFLDTTARSVT